MKFKEFFSKSSLENKEKQENIKSRVLLHITRHGEKEKRPDRTNLEQELTDNGKKQALEKGKSEYPASDASLAMGSNIIRSQQAGGFEMAGATGRDDITGEETLDELKEKLNFIDSKKLVYGTRLGEDKRLGFAFYNEEFESQCNDAYNNNYGLKWMVEESDEIAKKLEDDKSTSYLRAAGNLAQIIDKYTKIAKNFDKLIEDKNNEKKFGKQLERFLGSHAGALDLFLCRVVEKIKGQEERDKLVKALGNQGVDFAEGFEVEIDNIEGKNESRVRLIYKKDDKEGNLLFEFNEEIPFKIIEDIINQK